MSTETESMPIAHTFFISKIQKEREKLIMKGCKLAGLLAGVLLFESIFLYPAQIAWAEEPFFGTTETDVENTVSSNEGTMQKGNQASEVEIASEGDANVVHSGVDGDLSWSIDADGHLLVEGNGDYQGDDECGNPAWYEYSDNIYTATVNVSGISSAYKMFEGCTELTSVDLSGFDSSNVEDMCRMFDECEKLTAVDVSKFDTSKVTDMSCMFSGCSSLTELNLQNFDTSSVTDMSSMFEYCSSLVSLDISHFTVKQDTDIEDIINKCDSLASLYMPAEFPESVELPYNGEGTIWKDESGTICFQTAEDLAKAMKYEKFVVENDQVLIQGKDGNLDYSITAEGVLTVSGVGNYQSKIPEWSTYARFIKKAIVDVKGITSTKNMFYGCESLGEIDLSKLDTSRVTNMNSMFEYCPVQDLDLSGFDTSKVTDMGYMFACSSLNELDISGFDTSNVTNMQCMFMWCGNLSELDLSRFKTENVTNMQSMFYGDRNLRYIDLSNFDTHNVTDMSGMFWSCERLRYADVQGFNTEKVTNMSNMFDDCINLLELDLSGFDTRNVTNMSNMFHNCLLKEIDVSSFDTSKVTNMSGMFSGCMHYDLKKLDVSHFDTSNVTDMSNMFRSCFALTSLDLSSFSTKRVTSFAEMFNGCSKLQELNLKSFTMDQIESEDGMKELISGCSSLSTFSLPASVPYEIELPTAALVVWQNEKGEECLNTAAKLTSFMTYSRACKTDTDPLISGTDGSLEWII